MMTSAPTTFLSPTLRQLLVCCLLLFALAGCSALKTISTVSPPAGESRTGIEFSERTGLKLDIHLPPPDSVASDTAQATIVFFYGGGWEDGTREKYRFVASRLTELGYIVVIPDYRKYPEVVFPAFVEDAAEAVNWVRNKIGNYGGNPSNIWLAGHSAGAQIAALLHYDETWLARDRPATGDVAVGLNERRPPEGRTCAAVHFGNVEAVRSQVADSSGDRFSPSLHEGLCGRHFAVVAAQRPLYAAASLQVESGRHFQAVPLPSQLIGKLRFSGRYAAFHYWFYQAR